MMTPNDFPAPTHAEAFADSPDPIEALCMQRVRPFPVRKVISMTTPTLTTEPALTLAQRQAAYRQRQRAQGLKEIRQLWAHPDDEQAIRAHAEKLAAKRAKARP